MTYAVFGLIVMGLAVAVFLRQRRVAPVSPPLVVEEPVRTASSSLGTTRSGRKGKPRTSPANQIGEYLKLEELASGGTATVYRGVKVGDATETPVAVKVVPLDEGHNESEFRRRFGREVQILSALQHEGIVQFYDWGEDDDSLFLVEEFVSGGDLRTLLPDEGWTWEQFLILFSEIVAAVSYAHSKGVVHRDLKPENILVSGDQRIKIADFGLARSETLSAFTTKHSTLGTPHYMSPEQWLGREATPASDQYALGVIGYEMLTGRRPFGGADVTEIITQHMYENAHPMAVMGVHPVPPAVEEVVLRMMGKDSEDRFPSLDEVLSHLAACRAGL